MLSPEYLAGFFDGEGCVNFTIAGANRQLKLRVCIVNTDRNILELIRAQCGGSLPAPRKHKNPKWKHFNMLTFHDATAVEFLRLIQPFVRIKAAQIALAIEFVEFMSGPRSLRCQKDWIRRDDGQHSQLWTRTEKTKVRELDFKRRMNLLNRKGLPDGKEETAYQKGAAEQGGEGDAGILQRQTAFGFKIRA